MNEKNILQQLRECYIKKDIGSYKRKYAMGKWMILEENQRKVEEALLKLESEDIAVNYAIKEMGCKKIDLIQQNKNFN